VTDIPMRDANSVNDIFFLTSIRSRFTFMSMAQYTDYVSAKQQIVYVFHKIR
jgi:hypothetical protein